MLPFCVRDIVIFVGDLSSQDPNVGSLPMTSVLPPLSSSSGPAPLPAPTPTDPPGSSPPPEVLRASPSGPSILDEYVPVSSPSFNLCLPLSLCLSLFLPFPLSLTRLCEC